MQNMPLYTLFDTVRDRFNRHLGLADYMLLLEAMQQGIGIADKNELRDICAMLWLKNKPQQDQFKTFFENYNKTQVEDFLKAAKKTDTSIEDSLELDKALDKIGDETNNDPLQKPETNPSLPHPKTEAKATDTDASPAQSGKDTVTVQWDIGKMASGNAGKGFNTYGTSRDTREGGVSERRELSGKYIMTDNYHPFTERQLTQQWRRLRRRQVQGASRDIDLQATIKHVAQQGFFDTPVMQRHLVNDYRLVVLVDWKGSMLAFHTLSDLIVETLKQELPKTEVWYFRNHPQDYFYGRPDWTEAIETDKWLFQLAQNPAHILIVSDGGAARGNFVTERLQAWFRFFKQVKPIAPNIVWLNPMPQERWAGSTAGYVEKMVTMKPINDDVKSIKDLVLGLKR